MSVKMRAVWGRMISEGVNGSREGYLKVKRNEESIMNPTKYCLNKVGGGREG
jgi:hypothetical protein